MGYFTILYLITYCLYDKIIANLMSASIKTYCVISVNRIWNV